MKTPEKIYLYLFVFTLLVLVPAGFFAGKKYAVLMMATSTPYCAPTATLQEATTNTDTYANNANLNPFGAKSVVLSKAEYDAMTCLLNQFPTSTAFRVYFGQETSGALCRYVLEKTGTTLNTSVIYKISGTAPPICPPICDASDPIAPPNVR